MKTSFWFRDSSFPLVVAVAVLCQPHKATASPLLGFLDPLLNEVVTADTTLAVADALVREQEAAQAQVSAERLPTVSLRAQTGPSKSWSWNQDGRVDPSAPHTWGAQAGISARQNLWQGGVTALREEAAVLRTSSASLYTTKRRESLRVSLANDLLGLVTLARSLAQREVLVAQAKSLEKIASRKSASGFLGKKELQETQRETLRAELDLLNGQLEFDVRLARFNRTYGLKANALTKERLESYVPSLESAARAGESKIGSPRFLEEAAAQSLELRQAAASVKASELDATVALRQEWAPSLDLNASLDASRVDNASVPAAVRSQAADAQVSASASLSYSMSLFAPEARAAARTVSARMESTLLRRTQTERALQERADALADNKRLLQRRLEDSRKLLVVSEDLRDKNVRLFEAGEFDVVTVVASQQDVARQKQAELDVRARLDALGLEALALAETGVSQGGQSGGFSDGTLGSTLP
ncbi:MAG: TolC family protein [Silvanigrellales bacterium]|nr:TolC family protein [Silvanigrellales bacterium]